MYSEAERIQRTEQNRNRTEQGSAAITAPTPVSGNVADYVPKTSAPTKKQDSDAPAKPGGELGKDAFLKLLVTQLKYQDPSNPMNNTEFLAQTAQFTTVEKLTDLATVEQSLLNAQLQLGASNLIGRTVTYTDKDGKSQTGVVTSAKFVGTTPSLHVGNADIALTDIKEISAGGTAAQATAPAQNGQVAAPPQTGGAQQQNQQQGQPAAQAGMQNQPAAQTGVQPTPQPGPATQPGVQTGLPPVENPQTATSATSKPAAMAS
ncbi:flagellar hook capping FlgD N-terminal domain-containing protein [Dactylosporangium sp. CA-233914]|uniref:flagellar hook capping FlgD N-terminal domain-containing protein n=1 Tax=Dactylosporangium sp. CA-233914 TaxID=3239934 RepID=UPI003D9505FB